MANDLTRHMSLANNSSSSNLPLHHEATSSLLHVQLPRYPNPNPMPGLFQPSGCTTSGRQDLLLAQQQQKAITPSPLDPAAPSSESGAQPMTPDSRGGAGRTSTSGAQVRGFSRSWYQWGTMQRAAGLRIQGLLYQQRARRGLG